MVKWDKKEILALDRRHVWHPFTQMKDYEDRDPPVIVEAGRALKPSRANSFTIPSLPGGPISTDTCTPA